MCDYAKSTIFYEKWTKQNCRIIDLIFVKKWWCRFGVKMKVEKRSLEKIIVRKNMPWLIFSKDEYSYRDSSRKDHGLEQYPTRWSHRRISKYGCSNLKFFTEGMKWNLSKWWNYSYLILTFLYKETSNVFRRHN